MGLFCGDVSFRFHEQTPIECHVQIGKKTHEKGAQGRDGGRRGDEIPLDLVLAKLVFGAKGTTVALAPAGTTTVGNNASVHGNNVTVEVKRVSSPR
jgi:hypothetical protein